ncbi:MAG: UDP-N-acetylmuramyl-tripeptide synthetase [Candidatus Pacebacteria bacterium]|jgi:UDP-N-acetylmuramoyl-L-alanyl-D-glutamate--2,6-diaminopimelate ligase|nr:UDP-N-acetylmuramyl-tripeptide synthetase [Candidatus Paceibacterota bacterium]
METVLRILKKYIPKRLFLALQPTYHYLLAAAAACIYLFPSHHIKVLFVTGTKGKTSTAELAVALLEAAGYRVALAGTLRFKIAQDSRSNMYKMTIPGRFFVQRFLRRAVQARCDWAVLEMTSEGAILHRHAFVEADALIFTNLAKEHIESHGSYENYVAAKLLIAKALNTSSKKTLYMIANADDKETKKFFAATPNTKHIPFSFKDGQPYTIKNEGIDFTFDSIPMHSPLSGMFNLYNILAAAAFAKAFGISPNVIKSAVESFSGIRGRVEKINMGQDFTAVVDYAHTPDSLMNLYQAFAHAKKSICVLGNTGGGRDTWKRKDMALIAEQYCSSIILTNEDPYDEDPLVIVSDMAKHIQKKPVKILMDRREAVREALKEATTGDAVLITGKGTDPYIMGPHGTKIPWDDATVVREELSKLQK